MSMPRKAQERTPEELLADAARVAANTSQEPLSQIQQGMHLIAEYLSKQARTVASEQNRIQEKIQDGSRLTKHRFTV